MSDPGCKGGGTKKPSAIRVSLPHDVGEERCWCSVGRALKVSL